MMVCLPLVVGLVACGGSSHRSRQTGSSTSQNTSASQTSTSGSTTSSGGHSSPNASTGPATNKLARFYGGLATYGSEATGAERAAMIAVLERYTHAYASGDWSEACGLLATRVDRALQQLVRANKQLRGASCERVLKVLAGRAAAKLRGEQIPRRVLSVRVKDGDGFVLYSTSLAAHAQVPLFREGGAWRMGALAGSSL